MKWKQRELEFRLYVPAGNIWARKEDKYFTSIENWQDRQEEAETSLVLLNGFTVQYTGVKDVNKVKIFEGDICRYSINRFHQNEIGYVKYDPSTLCFRLYTNHANTGIIVADDSFLEVYGNVFQNPELVEKYKLEI